MPHAEFGRILRFAAVGLLNTAVGLGTIYACKYFLSLGDVPANVTGYVIGLVNSFLWNRRWTFSHSGATAAAAARFLATFVAAYAANLVTLLLLTRWGVDSYLSQALAAVPYTVVSYLGCRRFVFPPTRVMQAPAAASPALE